MRRDMRERGGIYRHWPVAVLIAGYAIFVLVHARVYAFGADRSGYLNAARLLSHGVLSEPLRLPPGIRSNAGADYFTPGEFAGAVDHRIYATRFMGWPLHIAVLAPVLGFERGGAVALAGLAACTLALAYLLALELGFSRLWARALTAAMAFYPVTLLHYLWAMSDGAATTWCLAAVYFAVRGRTNAGAAVAAGFSAGIAILVRTTCVLILPAVAFALSAALRPRAVAEPTPIPLLRRSITFCAGGAFPAALTLWRAYLEPAHPGFFSALQIGGTGGLFSWSNFLPRIQLFGAHLTDSIGTLAVLAWFASLLFVPFDPRQRLFALWAIPTIVFYACYSPAIEWWYMRFLLPVHAALLLAIAAVAQTMSQSIPRVLGYEAWKQWAAPAMAPCLFAGVVLTTAADNGYHAVWRIPESDREAADTVHWFEHRARRESPVFCSEMSGAVYFYSHFPIVRWDSIPLDDYLALRTRMARIGVPMYALLMGYEEPLFLSRYPEGWELEGRTNLASLWVARPPQRPL